MLLTLPGRLALTNSLSALLMACIIPCAWAADIYVTPSGSGTRDGSTWPNAKAAATNDAFNAAWNALTPGDTLHVGAGTYTGIGIKAAKGGEEGKPVRLVGDDRGTIQPLFTSNFDKKNPSKTGGLFFSAQDGASNFEISGLHLKGYQTGIFLRGRNVNVKISKLLVEEAREGIRSEAGATEDNPDQGTHNVAVSDCRFIKFTKRAIRLQQGNYKWRIDRCFADAGGKEWGTESFPICYIVSVKLQAPKDGSPKPFNPKDHDIEFYDCVAQNCYYEGTSSTNAGSDKAYWNGDGFCSESGVTNLKFVRCVSMHNTDGGWDLKADSPILIDCVSIDNKENYRFWAGTPKLTNCISAFAFKRGGSGGTAGLWTRTSIDAQYCTFLDNPSPISIDEKAGADTTLTFKDCIFAGAGTQNPRAKYENCVLFAKGGDDPRIPANKNTDGTKFTTEFNSAKYGTSKGYSSTRRTKAE